MKSKIIPLKIDYNTDIDKNKKNLLVFSKALKIASFINIIINLFFVFISITLNLYYVFLLLLGLFGYLGARYRKIYLLTIYFIYQILYTSLIIYINIDDFNNAVFNKFSQIEEYYMNLIFLLLITLFNGYIVILTSKVIYFIGNKKNKNIQNEIKYDSITL